MAYDRFLIAPYTEGLRTDLQSWLIPEEAFEKLQNAYVWRGRVRKRFGGKLMGTGSISSLDAPLFSRFRVALPGGAGVGITNGAGNAVAASSPGHIFKVGQQLSVADTIFTVISAAAGAQPMLSTNPLATGTFNIVNGAYTITGAPALTQVYFYIGEPVMGLCNYEKGAINNQPSFGFDTQWVYKFTTSWNRVGVAENVVFKGTDSDFFWTCNWNGVTDNQTALFISNFNAAIGAPLATDDPMWFYNEDAIIPWAIYNPPFTTAGDIIYTARIIIPFKDRLLLLNTIEQDAAGAVNSSYVNRCRYSHNGSPFAASAFLEVNQAGFTGGGYIDAPTEEAIISAEFIKDRLIVYFERSTWELAYTGNQVLPFTWQKINTELGSESTFSVVPFDKAVLGVGNTGIHACSGANVERIDTKIPEKIFQIANKNEGVERVVGIRDYYVEMVYWTMPNLNNANRFARFPNQVLVYNYKTNSWAYNDDCITMFGDFEQQADATWATSSEQWQENNSTWTSGVQQAQFRQVIAGNQQGYVFIVAPDESQNAPVMSITDISVAGLFLQLTIIDHTLNSGDFIYLNDTQGVTGLSRHIFEIQQLIDKDNILINPPDNYAGTYTGGGNVTRVSNIQITTKQYNPYIDKGRDVYVAKIEFGVKQTVFGQITIDYAPSASQISSIDDGAATNTLLGTSVLETSPYATVPLEVVMDRLWHPVYFQTEGECIQFFMYMSTDQMLDPLIAFEDFVLDGMVLYTIPTTPRLQ